MPLACGGTLHPSSVARSKVAHEVDQGLHAFERHRVVDRRTHAADRAMAFQREQAGCLRFLQERGVEFFARQGITIEQLHSTRYRAMQTGADMFSAQITIGIPNTMHIAALRDDFLEFCDGLNLDAIMDPMKF